MARPDLMGLETDPRFPSGPWTGFFIQPWIPGRHTMTLDLTFRDGRLEAQGKDWVGAFTFSGSYDPQDGKCRWTKQYRGKHQVTYAGVNEGKGIWGVWEIRQLWGWYHDRGVFHLWPEGMAPDAEADLTERSLLEDVGRRPPFAVLASAVGVCLLAAAYIFLRVRGLQWIETLFR
jgi:hypothetical protein